ncbi:carboxypeptidase-like regulatory domain-containing protein [Nocardioides piscis]|uniref:Carboxypeptidase regulatory-like domain-containing protein n=1 Tax=Nocardioides piscis TaxID=2714938 RepID=A0A6G7YEN8_9ACTN|nr:carboxypeptidase-like regulatory domain-containing protein [Nocardioides piscis]QIK75077.1 carboxypeptidase regulatory-like domain-containing protein [Nocardioides piscis]
MVAIDRFRLLLAALMVAVVAIAFSAHPPSASAADTASISGTVTDGTDPLPGVLVQLYNNSYGEYRDTVTASDGSYSFTGLPSTGTGASTSGSSTPRGYTSRSSTTTSPGSWMRTSSS